ncbi:MAG: LacI family transcriptional regulator [Lachnospiraceae bacterium]|nr:LacI family transcriptional regulator [Lachnospiraceae bacterium]
MTKGRSSKSVTIKQVASLAGVSPGTVSNMLNGTAPVAKETVERITNAIEELHYVPNVIASSLRSKTGKVIDVLTPNMNNTFYTRILSTFTELADKNGYYARVIGFEYSVEREKRVLSNLQHHMPAAVVIFNGFGDEEEIYKLIKRGIKVILADRVSQDDSIPSISFDNKKIFNDIVKMFKKKGYKKIGLFTELPQIQNIRERMDNFLCTLKKYGYPADDSVVFAREDLRLDNLKNGYQYMKEILEEKDKKELPDAWVASSDLLAIGMMKAARENGYSIPGELGIMGFDNIAVAEYVEPGLTTAEQGQELMGRELWKMVVGLLKGDKIEKKKVLPQKLIIRGSC